MAKTLPQVRNLQIGAMVYPPGEDPFDIEIVKGVDFDLEKGKVIGLIGEFGAGKSTIGLAALAYGRGGMRITGGSVLLDGKDILHDTKAGIREVRGRQVCYVAQSAAAAFNPAMRLGDQVIEATLLYGIMSKSEATEREKYLFGVLGLPEPETFGERFPHQVSGGQLQRAMTAMALCPHTDLIVFDEPTTALDVTTQIDVQAAIKAAIEETETAAIYITHDLAVVAQISDDIMVLRYGEAVEYETVEQIVEAPQKQYTSELISIRSEIKPEAPDQSEALLRLENIDAGYGSGAQVLFDVSMHLPHGQMLAVVGESGSGKSTTARVITGLLPPSKGQVIFDGQPLPPALKDRSKDQPRELQMIYQMPDVAMNPRQTVEEIIGRPLTFYFGLRGEARRRRVTELLHLIEMGDPFADRYTAGLSGGQKQRVCIARSLAAKPRLLICDEPTSALDPLVAEGILKLLLEL